VEELEKASESTNHENSRLRAQVERMTAELNEYKSKVSLMTNNRSYNHPKPQSGFGHAAISNLSDVNFQFEFPKFGVLPGAPVTANKQAQRSNSSLASPAARASNSNASSPQQKVESSASPANMNGQSTQELQSKDDLATFSGIFSPPLTSATVSNASRGSLDSGHYSISGPTATSSPSASSNSNMGPSSSCGTSPEPFTQSPMGFKPIDTMSTIGEEQPALATASGQGMIYIF
jgi:AP-1-like transcription factor